MHCEEYIDLISGHVDGINSAEDEARLQAHLQECEHCRALLEAYSSIDAILAQEDAEPPAHLKENIMQAVKATPRKHRNKKGLFVGIGSGLAAAACLAVILFSIPSLEKSMNDAVNEAAYNMEANDIPDAYYNIVTPTGETMESPTAYRHPEKEVYNGNGDGHLTVAAPEVQGGTADAEVSEAPLLIIWGAVPADIPALNGLTEVSGDLSAAQYAGPSASLFGRLQEICVGGKGHMNGPDAKDPGNTVHTYETDLATLQSIAAACSSYEHVIYYPSEMREDAVCTILVVEPQSREDLSAEQK